MCNIIHPTISRKNYTQNNPLSYSYFSWRLVWKSFIYKTCFITIIQGPLRCDCSYRFDAVRYSYPHRTAPYQYDFFPS